MALAAGVASGGVRSAPQASPALTRSEHLITTEKVLRGLSSLSVQRHGHSNYLKHIPPRHTDFLLKDKTTGFGEWQSCMIER